MSCILISNIGVFLSKSTISTWEFLEDLAEKTMQWKTARDDNLILGWLEGVTHCF